MPASGATRAIVNALTILKEPADSEVARSLSLALDRDMRARYPELELKDDFGALAVPGGCFFIVILAAGPVACGGFRPLSDQTAEFKRFYVDPTCRGGGVGRRLLSHLESSASAAGFTRAVLRTGVRQKEALALHRKTGWREIQPYSSEVQNAFSICLEKSPLSF